MFAKGCGFPNGPAPSLHPNPPDPGMHLFARSARAADLGDVLSASDALGKRSSVTDGGPPALRVRAPEDRG